LRSFPHACESARQTAAPLAGRVQQLAHQGVAPGVVLRVRRLLDLAQAVVQRVDQQAAPLGVGPAGRLRR
jgi:hypothetical protein